MPESRRRWQILPLFAATIAACEVSPTAVDPLDRAALEQMVSNAGRVEPAHGVMLDVLAALETRPAGPVALPALDSLFRLALETRVGPVNDGLMASEQEHRRLTERAWSALDAGDRDGERELAEARTFQAETVIRFLGPATAVLHIALVSRALDNAEASIATRDGRGPDHLRRVRTIATAREIVADAFTALTRGDAVKAIDLSGHAAGLANTLLRSRAGS